MILAAKRKRKKQHKIHTKERGFYGFLISFWICLKKRKIFFLDSEIRIWMFPKDAPHDKPF